jgi:hypothetical protein
MLWERTFLRSYSNTQPAGPDIQQRKIGSHQDIIGVLYNFNMGAAKSKPQYTSSARSVIARRSLEPDFKQSVPVGEETYIKTVQRERAPKPLDINSAVERARAAGQTHAAQEYNKHKKKLQTDNTEMSLEMKKEYSDDKIDTRKDGQYKRDVENASTQRDVPDEARFATNMAREQAKALREADAAIRSRANKPLDSSAGSQEESPYWSVESNTIDRINNHIPKEQPMDASILQQMSKWDVVKSKVDEDAIKLRTEGETMATVIRHQQDAEMVATYGRIPNALAGKLTEDAMVSLLRKVRDSPDSYTADDLAKKHDLKVETLVNVLKYSRHATITPQVGNKDLMVGK